VEVIKVADYEALSKKVCEIFINRLQTIENPVFGLATGSTPKGLYKCLVETYESGQISFANAKFFNLDEYIGLDKSHPSSYTYYLMKKLYEHIHLTPDQIYLPNGNATDLQEECARYEQCIRDCGHIDLQILGVGINGHIGFNEPGTPFNSRTDVVNLTESTMRVNSRFFKSIDDIPHRAITMGIGTIMESKEIIMLVSGKHKADTLQRMIHGNVTEDFPASILQKHPNVTVIADEEAFHD